MPFHEFLKRNIAVLRHKNVRNYVQEPEEGRPRRSLELQRLCLAQIASKLNLDASRDVYKLSSKDIKENGGAWVLRLYQDSPAKMFTKLYPHFRIEEEPWKYPEIRQRSWSAKPEMRRRFFDWAATQLGISDPKEWLTKSLADVKQCGGHFVSTHFKGSLLEALKSAYPDYAWPTDMPSESHNCRRIFDTALARLGLSLPQMYDVKLDRLSSEEELRLLIRYEFKSSLSYALVNVYPEHMWDIGKFKDLPSDPDARFEMLSRYFKENLATMLHISQMEDWYRVSRQDVWRITSRRFKEVESHLRFAEFLAKVYPEHHWDVSKFTAALLSKGPSSRIPRKRTSQRLLFRIVQKILGDDLEVVEDFYHPQLKMRFDVFVPKRLIALEYQGEQHFRDTFKVGGQHETSSWDLVKSGACQKAGITLLEIPYEAELSEENVKTILTPILFP